MSTQLVVIRGRRLDILDRVYFVTGSARIRARSFPLLNNVADVLIAHPEIARVQVEGHTDSVWPKKMNESLSLRRAQSVVSYLKLRGVAEERFQAVGFGERRPVQTNATREGRAANRRVEFVIIQRASSGVRPSRGRDLKVEP